MSKKALNTCPYCGKAVLTRVNWSALKCPVHAQMWEEDLATGLHLQNRLKDLQDDPDSYFNKVYKASQKGGHTR